MSSSSRSHSHVAHVEDVDDDSGSAINGIEATRKYAMSEARMSPIKIQPNTGKSRSDRRPVNSRSSSASVSFDESGSHGSLPDKKGRPLSRRPSERESGDPELRARDQERKRMERRLREEEEDRRAAAPARSKAKAKDQDSRPLRKQRPTSLKQTATQPVIQQMYKRGHVDNPANYGVQQPAVAGNRPRAQTRPASYYAGQPTRPGPMNMPWFPSHHPPAGFPIGSYPPPPWPGQGASPGGFAGPPPPSPVGPPAGYFDAAGVAANPHSHLRSRFETRPSSAMAYQKPPPPPPPPALDYYDYEEIFDETPPPPRVTHRPSKAKRAEDDRKRMPPPEHIPIRPQSAMPQSTPYRPPPSQRPPSRQSQSRPPPTHRRSVGFVDQSPYDDDDFLGDDGLFHDISPNASFDQRHAVVPRPRSRRSSVAYDHHDYDIVPATSRGRRASMYGSALPSGGVSLEDQKYTDALKYQEAVSGGAPVKLTAETLRKASKRGAVASSRSTRSSASRDDSEYRQSNATGLTRTSFNSDDFTIKVSGGARVRVPGAEIECEDGGEITFTTRQSGPRTGSDRATMIYPQLEDSRKDMRQAMLLMTFPGDIFDTKPLDDDDLRFR
ncbi:hypothetical protein VFPPC_04136 [Pochonia chlamydosporia 170]|uniref:Uncharacterized protein n=1 Tax=Pochonia chlamydosporia 170 TaxID=1380566 RepID=A0A179FQC9_METCM|nr:hypothetical protein VFPPC_04136 [Pochonia chlamydosporia 170]OAQ67792.1 hypothetical protein VFPPC_04136 [Pochonia chlamydosporia 170]